MKINLDVTVHTSFIEINSDAKLLNVRISFDFQDKTTCLMSRLDFDEEFNKSFNMMKKWIEKKINEKLLDPKT